MPIGSRLGQNTVPARNLDADERQGVSADMHATMDLGSQEEDQGMSVVPCEAVWT